MHIIVILTIVILMLWCRHIYDSIEPLVSKTYTVTPSIKQQQQQQKLQQQRLKQQRLKQQRLKQQKQLKKQKQKKQKQQKQLSSMPEFKGRTHIVDSSYGGASYF